MKFIQCILLIVIGLSYFFLVSKQSFAQVKKPATTADTLNKLTKEFVATYNNFSKTLDKESVLKYMDKSVSALLTNTNISKNVVKFKSDYKGFEEYLDKLKDANKKSIILSYRLTSIIRTFINEDMGVVTYTADYDIQKQKKLWAKGTETVVLAFKRLKEGWKIIHYTTTTIEDNKFVGECYCEFVELANNNFEIETMIPAGKSYEERKNKVVFEDVTEGDIRIRRVKVDNKSYRWELSSELFADIAPQTATTVNSGTGGNPTVSLGKVRTKQEVLEKIMLNYFQENCQEVKSKKLAKK
ncbi:MAG: hypothetical protein MUE81_05110 [Thermoflexibacter sp.]|jgi:hypothetical protein|nr:hypothetical protein [Thermoflexibacter sp.]